MRSQTIDFDAGQAGINVPLDFLDPLVAAQKGNGRITDLDVLLTLNVTTPNTGGAGAREDLLARPLQRLLINDKQGTRVDVTGASLRAIDYVDFDQYSFGEQQDLGQADTTTIVGYLHVPVEPCRAARPQDFRWRLADLRQGKIQLDWSPAVLGAADANKITINSGNAQVWVASLDEGKDEKKSRMIFRDYSIVQSEQTFPINGNLRYLLQYIGEVGESAAAGVAAWASQNLSSQALQLYSIPDHWFKQYYRKRIAPRRSAPMLAGADETDPVMTGAVIPIFPPNCHQPQTEMAPVNGIDWRTDATYGSGTFIAANKPRMIACYVEDRPDEQQCGGPGVVKTADGRVAPLDRVNPGLNRKLPVIFNVASR